MSRSSGPIAGCGADRDQTTARTTAEPARSVDLPYADVAGDYAKASGDLLERGRDVVDRLFAGDIASVYGRSSPHVLDALTELWGSRPRRTVARAAEAAMTAGGEFRTREVSLLAAGRGLPAEDLVRLLEAGHGSPSAGLVEVSPVAATAAATALASAGRGVHCKVLGGLVVDPLGLVKLRRIGAAAGAGLDLTGVKGLDPLPWVLSRVDEALVRPNEDDVRWGHLHGVRVDANGARLRVITTKAEFDHVGCCGHVESFTARIEEVDGVAYRLPLHDCLTLPVLGQRQWSRHSSTNLADFSPRSPHKLR